MAILLYTRRGCHLCEQAEDLLLHRGASVRLVDVDDDSAALTLYGLRVPVLEVDGVVLLEGRFDDRLLEAALRSGPGGLQSQVQPTPREGIDEPTG